MFKQAIEFMTKYRKRREQALANKERQRWFTGDIEALETLFTDTFSTDAENDEWSQLVADPKNPPDRLKTQAVRMKIAMLAGCRHDLRVQFAVGSDHHVKTEADFDRHAVGENRMIALRLATLEYDLDIRKQGAKTL